MTTPLGGTEKTKRREAGWGWRGGGRESALVTLTGSLSPRPGGGGGGGDFSALKIFHVFTLRDKVMMKEYGVGTDEGDRQRRDLKFKKGKCRTGELDRKKRI